MGNLYLGNQKSALNKAFIEIMQKLSVFPSKALTSSDVSLYQSGTSLQEWLITPTSEVEYMVYDADTLNLLDKNEETSTNYWKIIWKFPEPVSAKTLKMNMHGTWDGKFYATNDATACFNAWDSWTYSEELGEVLLEDAGRNEWGDMPLNPSQKYRYFFLSSPFNSGPNYFKEVELELGENDKPSDELLKVFPSEPITADSENFFYYSNSIGTGKSMDDFFAYDGDVAYLTTDKGGYKLLDKDIGYADIDGQAAIFKFKSPIVIKTVQHKDRTGFWSLYATDDVDAALVAWSSSVDYVESLGKGEYFIKSGESTQESFKDFPVNENNNAYKYYVFRPGDSGTYTYEIALKTE